MFRLIKQVFNALLSFNGSVATKCISLNNQLCMTRPTIIDLNPDEDKKTVSLSIYIDVMDVVILLLIHQVEYMFQIKWKM